MLAVVAAAMRIEVIMSSVLMPSVMLVIVGITCQRFDGGLLCDESPVVISIGGNFSLPVGHLDEIV